MKSWITTPQVTTLLDSLYADAAANDPLVHQAMAQARPASDNQADFYLGMRKAYMAVGREFGTSFGVSTIYLAAALRDNGAGRIITTEFAPNKAERARQNLAAAGLESWVEFRVGDARETLLESPSQIDMIFLDGPKNLYLDVLRLLEPHLRSQGIVASDNTDHDGMEAFLDYLRNPVNGYTSAAIQTEGKRRGHEVSVRN